MSGSGPMNFLLTVSKTFSNTVRRCASLRDTKPASLLANGAWPLQHTGAIAIHEHAAPELRHRLRPERLQQAHLPSAERLGHISAGRQSPIELAHQAQTELIV